MNFAFTKGKVGILPKNVVFWQNPRHIVAAAAFAAVEHFHKEKALRVNWLTTPIALSSVQTDVMFDFAKGKGIRQGRLFLSIIIEKTLLKG